MTATKPFIILGYIAAYYAVITNLASSYRIYTRQLDNKCNVYFNVTQYEGEQESDSSSVIESILKCYNKERNLTEIEQMDCEAQCFQVSTGLVKSDGALDPKLPQVIEEQYKKYSNATTSYIDKVVEIFKGCEAKATTTLKLLQSNGTDIGECKINGLYFNCCSEFFWYQLSLFNGTDDLCGNE